MNKRSSIRNINKIKPMVHDDYAILYCSHKECPLNSLYCCTYCNKYKCINHAKRVSVSDETIICLDCIINNKSILDIYNAIEYNNNYVPVYKRKFLQFLSMEWIYCGSNKEYS